MVYAVGIPELLYILCAYVGGVGSDVPYAVGGIGFYVVLKHLLIPVDFLQVGFVPIAEKRTIQPVIQDLGGLFGEDLQIV